MCLMQALYKLYATMLLQRLQAARAKSRVWPTQVGLSRRVEPWRHSSWRDASWTRRGKQRMR
eukprot:5237999-Pyramimonas_sp.AAC.1